MAKRVQPVKTEQFDYADLFKRLPGTYLIIKADDPAFTVLDENQAHADMALKPGESAIGRPMFEVFPDTSDKYKKTGVNDLMESFRRVIKTGKPDTMDTFRYDIKGRTSGQLEERYWRVTHYPVSGDTGNVSKIFQDTKDITEEMRAQRKLEETESRLDEALRIGQVGSWMWDIPKDIVIADQNLARLFGVDEEGRTVNLPLKKFTDAIHPHDRERIVSAITATIKSGGTFEEEYRTYTVGGDLRWVLARGRIEHDESGAPVRFPGVIVDITDRKRIDTNLRFLANASTVLTAALDYKKTLRKVAKLCVPTIADWCAIDIVDSKGAIQQVALEHRDPKRTDWANKLRAARPVDLDDTSGVPNVIRSGLAEYYTDIPDDLLKKRAKSEEEYKLLKEFGFKSVMLVPLQLQNKTVGVITIVSSDSGRHYQSDDFEMAQELGNRTSLAMTNARLFQTVRSELEERSRLETELRKVNEELEHRVASRTAELQSTNTQLERSNQELQDFAYVASHDLQEPLRKIQAFSNLLSSEYAAALGEGRDYLERMQNAAARMSTLIEDLLSFSRVTTKAKPFEMVDMNKVVREVVSDLETRIDDTSGSVDPHDLPTIKADPVQMRQLMQNLIGNALKFARPGVAPIVRVSAHGAKHKDGTIKEYVFSVTDNGIGFDEKYLDRIFAVFQRLHGRERYQGTGIGLAICRKIAERHDGSITATSTPDYGSTFLVTIPANPREESNA